MTHFSGRSQVEESSAGARIINAPAATTATGTPSSRTREEQRLIYDLVRLRG